MPTIIAYGEDALTYWALTTQTEPFLRQLGDDSPPEAALVVYRPSFGRRGAAHGEGTGGTPSAQFGEFDAIVATSQAIYLVESKWDASSELRDGVITLRPEQCARHRVLRWYLDRWFQEPPANWPSFVAHESHSFQAEFPGLRLAPEGSVLARNLRFLLDKLSTYGHDIRDALLYLTAAKGALPCAVEPKGFTLVTLPYRPLEASNYFELFKPT